MKAVEIVAVAATVLGAIGYASYSAQQRALAEQEVKRLSMVLGNEKKRADSLQVEAGRRDTVYRTIRVRYDSLLPGDTVRVRDTLYVRKDIADTTIHACTLALGACQRAGFAKDAVVLVQDSVIRALRQRPGPCRVAGVSCGVLGLVGGFAAGVLIAK